MSPHFDFRPLSLDARLELATDLLDSIAAEDPTLLGAREEIARETMRSGITSDDADLDDASDGPGVDGLDDETLDALIAREAAEDDEEDSYEAELARRGFAEYAGHGRGRWRR